MVESREHKLLKLAACEQLNDEGFKNIFEEYNIMIEKKKFRVDVVGFKDEKSVAIECGSCEIQKMRWMRKRFTEVRWIPYHGNLLYLKYKLLNPYRKLKEINVVEPMDEMKKMETEKRKSPIIFIEKENTYFIATEGRESFAIIYFEKSINEWLFKAFDSAPYTVTALQKIVARVNYLNQNASDGHFISFLKKDIKILPHA